MMPCRLNHNLIDLGLGPLFKGLRTNLKLLTNSNAQFPWTLLLGPLFKVALIVDPPTPTKCVGALLVFTSPPTHQGFFFGGFFS
jgi:hypothetical protein